MICLFCHSCPPSQTTSSSKAGIGSRSLPDSQHLGKQCLLNTRMDEEMNEWSVVSPYRIEHLGLNVVLQLLVGVPLEMVHGATRIGLVYVAGVVAGRQVGPLSVGETSRATWSPCGLRQASGFQGTQDPHHQSY